MEIIPLSPVVGAEVRGVDMRRRLPPDEVRALDQAFTRHGVLLFRRQPLSPAELVAFSRQFGALQPHVQRRYQHPEAAEVVIMTNRKPDGSFDDAGAHRGAMERTRDGWHSDLSYDPVPAKATLLHAVEIPSSGGNTCFANVELAYRDLPAEVKARLLGRAAEFIYGGHQRNAATAKAAGALDAAAQASARAVHPAVTAHPETGRPGIYMNPVLTTRILDVPEAESEALMETVFDCIDRPVYRWEHVWSVGDTLMWDNRGGTMHTGRLDYPRNEARRFIRTTVTGQPTIMYQGGNAMKLCFFDDFKLGVIKGDSVVDVSAVVRDIPHTGPGNLMNGLIERFGAYRAKLDDAVAKGTGVPLASVKLRPPLPKPVNIDCMAVNYMEDGTLEKPAPINGFHKSPSAIIGPGDTMVLPDVPATIFEGEAELGAVIGKRASNVKAADAMGYIFGYVNFIDGSARGLPPSGNVFFQMKSRDTFAPIGPYLVTADEVKDPQKLQVRLWVNGQLKQNFNTDDMAHKIPRCIEWATSIHTLEPGDILATGTNHRGLSSFQDGDKVELECEGMGKLHFFIKDELKRTWSRETRLDRKNKGFDSPTPQVTGKHAPAKA